MPVAAEIARAHARGQQWRNFGPSGMFNIARSEIWFSILYDPLLAGASFTSVAQLRAHIDDFVGADNERAR
jgi:hypothetical protein